VTRSDTGEVIRMTVEELVRSLSFLDPKQEVLIEVGEGEEREVREVCEGKGVAASGTIDAHSHDRVLITLGEQR
jgi:hypothetical protein